MCTHTLHVVKYLLPATHWPIPRLHFALVAIEMHAKSPTDITVLLLLIALLTEPWSIETCTLATLYTDLKGVTGVVVHRV